MKKISRNFPFALEIGKNFFDTFVPQTDEIKPNNYAQKRSFYVIGLINKFLVHFGMLKFNVSHWMVVDKVHKVISFK